MMGSVLFSSSSSAAPALLFLDGLTERGKKGGGSNGGRAEEVLCLGSALYCCEVDRSSDSSFCLYASISR